jgi:signal recognition particle subunit SRP54
MFENLTDKLNGVFKRLRGHGKLTPENITSSLREVRMALLEADVHYKVARDFIDSVKERAVGQEVVASLTPGHQVVKIVYDELTRLMGSKSQDLNLHGECPIVILLVGLQGSGKTTTAGKLAVFLRNKGRKPFLVPADVYRPAAIDQLKKLGSDLGVPVYDSEPEQDPVQITWEALAECRQAGADVLIVDTAGRLHVDEELMGELKRIKATIKPTEILMVADAMTGQDAVNVAEKFNQDLQIDGVILTKLDGDARGGAALSIRSVVNKPIKLVGVGEKLDALEVFYPDRMASRILGMGDIVSLAEKAQAVMDQKKAQELEKKIRKDSFTLEDFKNQLVQIKKMGSLEQIISMIPGMGKIKQLSNLTEEEGELKKIEAIINSMTRAERLDHTILNASRRRRISDGSGTTVQDVNKLLKNFMHTKKMLRNFTKGGIKGFLRGGRGL